MQFPLLSARLPSLMKFQAILSSERSSETLGASLTASTCKYGGSGRLDRRLRQAASGFLRLIFEPRLEGTHRRQQRLSQMLLKGT